MSGVFHTISTALYCCAWLTPLRPINWEGLKLELGFHYGYAEIVWQQESASKARCVLT